MACRHVVVALVHVWLADVGLGIVEGGVARLRRLLRLIRVSLRGQDGRSLRLMLHVRRLARRRSNRWTLLRIGVGLHVRRVRVLAVRMCLSLRVIHHGWHLVE